jgi:hypothetical protein
MDLLTRVGNVILGISDELNNTRRGLDRIERDLAFKQMQRDLDDLLGEEKPKAPEKENITFAYSLESLSNMETNELRKEVWSVYQENKDWTEIIDKRNEIAREARSLYFGEGKYSKMRYRAMLIKFLCENGTI